eukprot:UN34072
MDSYDCIDYFIGMDGGGNINSGHIIIPTDFPDCDTWDGLSADFVCARDGEYDDLDNCSAPFSFPTRRKMFSPPILTVFESWDSDTGGDTADIFSVACVPTPLCEESETLALVNLS